jgi:trehalose 6-phosphate phosphatase
VTEISLSLQDAALFFDLDGTLAGIVDDPAMVGPDARRNGLLVAAQSALGGRLAVISGRAIADLDRILGGCVTLLAGLHGLEQRGADGSVKRIEAAAGMEAARAAARAFAAAHEGVALEDKGPAIAIHYRAAPEHEAEVRAFAEEAAQQWRLVAQPGKMVAELRTRGADKGDALAAFMASPGFSGSKPIFVGDDLTDEAGFAAAAALGGLGVLVGQERATAAIGRLAGPGEVLGWLERGLERGEFNIEGGK